MKPRSRLAIFLLGTFTLAMPAQPQSPHPQHEGLIAGPGWSAFAASMEKMHAGMASVAASGDNDADFVNLMLPHHQAAIDMARTQLLYGKDPQMRRLAQEIIADQQSEIELMQRWVKERAPASTRLHPGKDY